MSFYDKHKESLEKAIKALKQREFYEHFPEHPAAYDGETAQTGYEAYHQQLGKSFEQLLQEGADGKSGEEKSPYTNEALAIDYPVFPMETLIQQAEKSGLTWRKASVQERSGLLMESLAVASIRFHEIALATQHTTGQSYLMSFQASGPHAADRAIEAIATGLEQLTHYPEQTNWIKPIGKGRHLHLKKTFKAIPKGIGLVIGCSTFPTWNTLPGLYANLITGNPSIVKPHPLSVYPIAIYVAELQKILKENGFDPHLVQLAVDHSQKPIAKKLAEHPSIKIIDFTGNTEFGNFLESLKDKTVFTEKAGLNSVILDSAKDLRQIMKNLAFSVSLYSGQMCTSPQNFFIPETGMNIDGEMVSYAQVVDVLQNEVSALALNPKMGPGILGTIQNEQILNRAKEAKNIEAQLVLDSPQDQHPEYENARVQAPSILELNADQIDLYNRELFGPTILVIKTQSTQQSIELVKQLIKEKGTLTCSLYCINNEMAANITEELNQVFAPVSLNFTGFTFVNQHAAFSDFHGTAATAAGNASYTDTAFVNRRFVWVGNRTPG